MSLREKIGQMLMVPFFGSFASAESPDYKSLLHQVADNHVGGLILATAPGPYGIERSRVYPTMILANELQRSSKIPLLIGADFESGTAMRIEEGTRFPSAMAIAATDNPDDARMAGACIAREARAAGIHWIFAPVADINENPDNPIINVRSFGEDPRRVAACVAGFVRGAEEYGVLATAKHFPGHGDVSVDTHLALASVLGSRAKLEQHELAPFRAAIAAGARAIMPGHLAVPALESDATLPATLSRSILTGVLRKELKFRGLIITDALDMGAVMSLHPPGEIAVRAVDAGADVLLMPPVPDAAVEGLLRAVQSGRTPEERIDSSVRRILQAKERLHLHRNRLVNVARIAATFGLSEFQRTAEDIATRGVTLLRDTPNLLPLDATRPMRLLLVVLSADPDPCPGRWIEQVLREHADSVEVLRADTRFIPVSMMKLPPPDSYDAAIAALFVRVADRKGTVGFPMDQREIVNQLLAAGRPVAIASFGSPYLIAQFPAARTWLAQFSTGPCSQRTAAGALFGQNAISGKIPVTVPEVARRGDGLPRPPAPMTLEPADSSMAARLKPVHHLLDRAVAEGAFPGGVLAVGWQGRIATHAFGTLTRAPRAPRVSPETIYDVASLTKPIVTAAAAMMLAEQKLLDFDAPLYHYLPGFVSTAQSGAHPEWRTRVTVRMLLLHTSGLPAHREFFKALSGNEPLISHAMAEPLIRKPGSQTKYSDLGFILLGHMVETLTGKTLGAFAQERIFSPLGMHSSFFRPPQSLRARIAPTELDASFRRRLIRGEVHDENAWALGGVAGHAGLFSTAVDIAVFAQMLLNGGIYGHRRLLARSTVAEFTAHRSTGGSARTLGWDVPTAPSSSGRYFSPRSFGHTGFTGTSLWVDPDRKLFVVLLTNRVNPARSNEMIRQVRPAVHDAIFESLGLSEDHPPAS